MTTFEDTLGGVVHACPPDGESVMPCCGRTPFETPMSDRMTVDPKRVTCGQHRGTSHE